MLLYAYPRAFKGLLLTVYLGGGAAVWLFARDLQQPAWRRQLY